MKDQEINFLEVNIKALLKQMEDSFRWLMEYEILKINNPDPDLEENRVFRQIEFVYLSDRLYNLCVVYFELRNLPLYIPKFDSKILPLYQDTTKLATLTVPNVYDEQESVVIKAYKQFLYPFEAFGSVDQRHFSPLKQLEKILHSTSRILNERGIKPSKESEVYNAVKTHCEISFSDAQMLSGFNVFSKTAKCYKPDILIPSLKSAVEYKYAETIEDLTRTIDEICIDVKGYSEDSTYTIFYAVFYVKVGIIAEDRFNGIWREKNFPDNWTGIFVEGEVSEKSPKTTQKNSKSGKK